MNKRAAVNKGAATNKRPPSAGSRRSEVHMEFHGHSKTVLNWLLGLSGTVVLAMLAGSYTFTYLQAESQDMEKSRWREEHSRNLNDKLAQLKESQAEIKNTANDLQKVMMEQTAVLREMNARAQIREDYNARWERSNKSGRPGF